MRTVFCPSSCFLGCITWLLPGPSLQFFSYLPWFPSVSHLVPVWGTESTSKGRVRCVCVDVFAWGGEGLREGRLLSCLVFHIQMALNKLVIPTNTFPAPAAKMGPASSQGCLEIPYRGHPPVASSFFRARRGAPEGPFLLGGLWKDILEKPSVLNKLQRSRLTAEGQKAPEAIRPTGLLSMALGRLLAV